MSGRSLVELAVVAENEIGQLSEALSSPGLTPAQIERGYSALADWHRVAGVCSLRSQANADGFRTEMRAAGEARRDLLRARTQTAKPFNSYTGAGRYLPLCCAVAAGADELAVEIAKLSADAPVPREEIEEDALYGVALCALVQGTSLAAPLMALEQLVGEEDPRCGLLRVLLEKNQDEFGPRLEALRATWAEWFDSIPKMNRGEAFQADRGLFVEGLALLRIATRLGIQVADEYPHIPSLARVP